MAKKQILFTVTISCEDKILAEQQTQTNSDVFDYNDGATMRDKLFKIGNKAIKEASETYKTINIQ